MTGQDYKTYLVSRVEETLATGTAPPIVQQPMFGGVAFMMNGNMLCCASNKGLMLRVGAIGEEEDDLAGWLALARRYVESLPPKHRKTKTPK